MNKSILSDFPFLPKCTCNRRCDLDSDTSDDFDDDDSSYIDEESEDESSTSEKFFFISAYKNTILKDTIIIIDEEEIIKYRLKFSKLTNKTVANVKNLWGSIIVKIPILGSVTLKTFIENFVKGSNKRKKQLKRPLPSMKLKSSNSNGSENSDTTTTTNTEKLCSAMKLEKSKEELKEGNNTDKKNIDKKLQKVNTNSTPQSEDKKTNNKIENKLDINNKIQTVNNADKNMELETNIAVKAKELEESKNQTLVNDIKSIANKVQKNNSTLIDRIKSARANNEQKPNSVNNMPTKVNSEKNENKNTSKHENKTNTTNDSKNQTPVNNRKPGIIEDQKNNSVLTDVKGNMIKDQKANSVNNTPSKVKSEKNENKSTNKYEIKSEEKFNSANQSSTPKKSNLPNMVNKNENINLTNGTSTASDVLYKALQINTPKKTKNEIKNSVNEPKSSNIVEKSEKKDLTNTPSKKTSTVDKNKQTISGMNNNTKQTVPEFKKPLDVKPSLNNNEQNSTVKISNKSSAAQVESDHTENNIYEETLDKATKKKLKKQRQKEKKIERSRRDSSNCSSRATTDNSSPDSINKKVNKINKKVQQEFKKTDKKQEEKELKTGKNQEKIDTEESEVEKDEYHQSEYVGTSDDEVDFLTDDENLPVFLAKIKEKYKNKEKNKVNDDALTALNSSSTKVLESKDSDNGNNEQEFVIYSKKRNKTSNHVIDKSSIFYSESFADNACYMILENNFMGALQYLVDAIDFNYTDQRHYLNRCYCYLSMKKNALALADAQYIIQISSNVGYLFIANVRAAQASYGLQRYDQAEDYMKEAIRLNSTSVYVERELILIQVARIASMGFSEKDALLALEKYSSVQEAINYLLENNTDKLNNSKNEDLEISLDNYDEFDYSSDEDEYSNAEIVNRILNYEPGTVKFQHIVAKPANAHPLNIPDNGKNIKKEKKVLLNGKANSGQEKAIWVGNLTSSITDTMLKKKFKEFGKVISVYHPLNESYAFINFEKAEDVTNVLTNTPCHEVAGVKLLIKSAIRQK